MDITEEFGCNLTSTWLSLRQPIRRCVPMVWRRDKEIKQHRDPTSGTFTLTTRAPDTSTAERTSYVPHDIFTHFFAREQKQRLPTLCPSQIKCDPEEPCLGWDRKQRLCVEKNHVSYNQCAVRPSAGGLRPEQLQSLRRGHAPPAWKKRSPQSI